MKLDNQKMKTIYFTDEAVKKQTERYEFLSEYYDKIFPETKERKDFSPLPEERKYAEIIPITTTVKLWPPL